MVDRIAAMTSASRSVASRSRAARRSAAAALVAACAGAAMLVVLAGCGQKGPLYLPPPAGAASAPAR
jgi:predicted small lipoprotein YifL